VKATISTVRGPAIVKRPALAGTAKAGHRLRCSAGTWTHATKFTYAWARNGKTIKGEAQKAYTVRRADRGSTLTCAVTAAGAGGTRTVTTRAVRVKK
jgi:hypothetical protein